MSLPLLTGSSSIVVACIRNPWRARESTDAGPHTQAFWFSRSEVRPETLHFFFFFFLRRCISDKLPGDFDGLVYGPPKERVLGGGTRWGGGDPGRPQELPRFALHPRFIRPRLGFLPYAGPGDGGLAHVALHTSVSSLSPHTINEHLFGAGSRLGTGRT